MSFSVGDRVVCVDSSMQPEAVEELKRTVPNWVKKDEQYTIREIKTIRGIVSSVLLEEIDNPVIFFKILVNIIFKLKSLLIINEMKSFMKHNAKQIFVVF
jgi:hypothetical protein